MPVLHCRASAASEEWGGRAAALALEPGDTSLQLPALLQKSWGALSMSLGLCASVYNTSPAFPGVCWEGAQHRQW